MAIQFVKAERQQRPLKMCMQGVTGVGKTFNALRLASAICRRLDIPPKIAVLDTENMSSTHYTDEFSFDVIKGLKTWSPLNCIEVINDAQRLGYSFIIIDSLSLFWSGKGGTLEMADEAAAKMRAKNTFAAWKDVSPIQNQMLETITGSNIHLIATLRTKMRHEIEQDDKGKNQVRKMGMAPIQREGIEYEFDIILDLDLDHSALVTKSRMRSLADRHIKQIDDDIGFEIADWLKGGKPADDVPKSESVATGGTPAPPQRDAEPPPPRIDQTKADHIAARLKAAVANLGSDTCRELVGGSKGKSWAQLEADAVTLEQVIIDRLKAAEAAAIVDEDFFAATRAPDEFAGIGDSYVLQGYKKRLDEIEADLGRCRTIDGPDEAAIMLEPLRNRFTDPVSANNALVEAEELLVSARGEKKKQ